MVLCWFLTLGDLGHAPLPGLSSWEPESTVLGMFLLPRGVVLEMFAECMELL